MNDKSIRQDVIDELEFEPGVNATHIGAAVDHGIVTLGGHVGSYLAKMVAERAAWSAPGVMGVEDRITVS